MSENSMKTASTNQLSKFSDIDFSDTTVKMLNELKEMKSAKHKKVWEGMGLEQ